MVKYMTKWEKEHYPCGRNSFAIRIKKDSYKKLREISDTTGRPMLELINEAVDLLYRTAPSGKLPLDEVTDGKA